MSRGSSHPVRGRYGSATLSTPASVSTERWASEVDGVDSPPHSGTPARDRTGRAGRDLPAACVGALLLAATAVLPWVSAGVSGDPRTWTGTSLPVVGLGVVGLAVAIVVGAFVDRATWAGARSSAALAAACVGVAACALFIVLIELASSLVPDALLPEAVRRLGLTVEPGPGPWLALTVLATLATTLVAGRRRRAGVRRGLSSALAGRGIAAIAFLGLAAATAALAWLRYVPWTNASVAHRTLDVQGWATPWVGPVSLFAVWLMVAALVIVMLVDATVGALVAAGAAWLAAFNAALVIVFADALGSVHVDRVLPRSIRGAGPELSAASSAWGVYAAGLAAAAASALLIASRSERGAVAR
jgi:hypothetical protein